MHFKNYTLLYSWYSGKVTFYMMVTSHFQSRIIFFSCRFSKQFEIIFPFLYCGPSCMSLTISVGVFLTSAVVSDLDYATTNFFFHTKTAAIYPGSVHRAQGLCDVCHADLSPSCTPPSLFIRTKTCLWHLRHHSEPLHKHGKPDQFQSRQTAPPLRPVSFAEQQT